MNEKNFTGVDLNLLITFVVLMEELSATKAAARLHLSQSAVSHALRRLRDLFGDALLVRVRHGLEATPRARALYCDLRPCLDTIEAKLRDPEEFTPATSERVFRLGLPSALDVCITPVLLRRLREEAPEIKLIIRPIDAQTGPDKLDSGEVELGLSHFPTVKRWHRKQEVGLHNFSCIYDGQRLKARAPITLKAYLAADHVLPSFSGDLTGEADEALATNGHKRHVVAATVDFSSIPFYLSETNAVATMPTYAARIFADRLGLTLSPLPFAIPDFSLSMIWHSRHDQDAGHLWFRSLVGDIAAGL